MISSSRILVLITIVSLCALQLLWDHHFFKEYESLKVFNKQYSNLNVSRIENSENDILIETHSAISSTYSNPYIVENNCTITVVLYEPNIDETVMWALESAASNIYPKESTCFLLQTSICQAREKLETDMEAFAAVAQSIKELAKPNFLAAIERGNVRMTVIDTDKYKLSNCHNFRPVSSTWWHIDYWGSHEFSEQDSDMILTIQKDVVLCHPLYPDNWREFAFVGAPFAPKRGNAFYFMCSSMPRSWNNFHGGNVENLKFPPYPTEDEICTNHEVGPQGNGGSSIRSRAWIRKAIRYCPTIHSGLSEEEMQSTPCNTTSNRLIEDMFYATVLRGMGAPLPTLYEAALFGSEMRSIEDFVDHYKLDNVTHLEEMVKRRWWAPEDTVNGGLKRYHKMQDAIRDDESKNTISISLHKPWSFNPIDLQSDYVQNECPYLKYILPK